MITTRRGRVVYNRKPNKFKCKDVIRVIRAVDNTREDLRDDVFCWEDVFKYVFRNLLTAEQVNGRLADLEDNLKTMIKLTNDSKLSLKKPMGGGSAGGGGASGEY